MTTFKALQTLAVFFINEADNRHKEVSNYLNGSNRQKDVNAYYIVKDAYRNFIKAYNEYCDEHHDDALDYLLAESVIY